jgi:hypothetical protein
MQAATRAPASTFDSAVLHDFGDGPVFQDKGKERADERQEGALEDETQSESGHSGHGSQEQRRGPEV